MKIPALAIRETFDAIPHRLERHARHLRGAVKSHDPATTKH